MLSIIVPCYNGETHIKNGNITAIYEYLELRNTDFEIIVVNDGSIDNSLRLLNLKYSNNPKIKIISYDKNKGKGNAIKIGINNSSGDILFMDIDLAVSLDFIEDIELHRNDYKIIIGSRNLKRSKTVKKTLIRKIMSFGATICIRVLVGVKEKDTQCGFKYIEKDVAKMIVEKQIVERWAFDVEYLYIAKKYKINVLEIPVIWQNAESSTVSPIKSSIRFFKELIIIRKNMNNY